MKLLIIEPWFCGMGHPAQSLLTMASAIGQDERVEYLISSNKQAGPFQEIADKLGSYGVVINYGVTNPVGWFNTVKALLVLGRMHLEGRRYQRIFFFDESLLVLALLWPFFAKRLAAERLAVLHLFGPRTRARNWLTCFIIGRFLARAEIRFYLRTEELARAWREAYPSIPGERIRYLCSLEIPDDEQIPIPATFSGTLSFGILGQVRIGKGIEWLVPVFRNDSALGRLTVAGEFASPRSKERLSVLEGFTGFINKFLPESDMLELAAKQDYLLILYDIWDKRMESAVLFLAARVNRPVIVYRDGWCGRMVREFGCGLAAPTDHAETVKFLHQLPRPGSDAYAKLLAGMTAFRETHSVKSLRGKVMQELLG